MNYDTAFRPYLAKWIEKIESADIVVGIPCYNNEATIANVMKQVSKGLARHDKSARSVILISDGGSTEDTREIVREEEIEPWQEKIVFIYRGISGKGTALRAIFEAVEELGAKACAVVDADLRAARWGGLALYALVTTLIPPASVEFYSLERMKRLTDPSYLPML
jgi:glycosyltransferase involved in cell wall biosynthesis